MGTERKQAGEARQKESNTHFLFVLCISLAADGLQRAGLPTPPTATLSSCLW